MRRGKKTERIPESFEKMKFEISRKSFLPRKRKTGRDIAGVAGFTRICQP